MSGSASWRVAALQALYAIELTNDPEADISDLPGKARKLVAGVMENREALDAQIESVARGWRLDRMPIVDRNVLRIAAYELAHTGTPVAVVIDEAVEIAKTHSTDRSGAFVNGVLGAIASGGQADA